MFSPITFAVEALRVERNYRPIFKPLSTTLVSGDVLYIKGKNGVGKTTSLRALAGITSSYRGAIYLNGIERKELLHEYGRLITYIGHSLSLKEDLTALENIQLFLKIRGMESLATAQIEAVFSLLSIPTQDRALRYLSAGQKRRVALSRLWLENLPIWILDEPFTALDNDSITLLEEKIRGHRAHKGIVIFTSHQAPDSTVYSHELEVEPY